jgi:hypothetical protein
MFRAGFLYNQTMHESLKNAEYKKLNRIILACRDFQESLSAITFMLEEMDPQEEETYTLPELRRLRCYETTAIVAYARAFNSQRKGKRDPFSFEDINLNLNQDEYDLHEKLVGFRDEIYAHSDADTADYSASIGEFEIRDCEVMRFMRPQHFEGTRLRWNEYRVFERLNQKAMDSCMKKMSVLSINHKDKFKVFSHKMSSARNTIKPESETD